MARLLDSTRSARSTRLKNRDTFAAVDLLGLHLGLAQFTSHIAICDEASFRNGLYVNPDDAFALPQRLLLHHLPAVAYHRRW